MNMIIPLTKTDPIADPNPKYNNPPNKYATADTNHINTYILKYFSSFSASIALRA